MTNIKRIILTTDYSDGARKAYPFAALLAQRFGAKILLVHFRNKKAPEHSGISDEDHLSEILQSLKNESEREEFTQVQIAARRLDRNIAKSLPLYVAETNADLVLTAIRRRKGIEHFFLSDIGEEVLAKSPIPVFVYASPKDSNYIADMKRVIVPFTCAAGMTDALPWVTFFAEYFKCEFHFLLVTPQSSAGGKWYTKLWTFGDDTRQSVEATFNQMKQSELLSVDADLAFASGISDSVIAEFANSNEIDLALIGHRGFEKGICKRIVYRANCSVMKLVRKQIHEV